jgi:spore coat protein A, manganese oxidase
MKRRALLKLGVLGGSATLMGWRLPGLTRAQTRHLAPFSVPLGIPPVLRPAASDEFGDHYELTIKSGAAQLRDGQATQIWGFEGIWPGPTIRATRGRPTYVHATNLLSHEVNIHNHGHKVPAESDGHPLDIIRPGDSRIYVYPNDQDAATYWYHDHTMASAENIYRGLAGFYLIDDPAEHELNLPSGEYDVPLMIQDRALDARNRLAYELNERTIETGVFGDMACVNGVLTPYFGVANRKYRFRLVNAANRRAFALRLGDGDPMTVIGSDGGLLEAPARVNELSILSGERFDVVIDFAHYPIGSSVILHNTRTEDDGLPYPSKLPDLMRFDVIRSESDPSDVPPRLAAVERLNEADAVMTRRFVLDFIEGHWMINGRRYDPSRVDADPRLGSTEIWEFENRSEQPHDLHLHLVEFQNVVGTRRLIPFPDPIRRDWKDTRRVAPGTTSTIIVRFDGYPGVYAFHCHMLEHAEHMMMGQFEVVGPDGARGAPTRRDSLSGRGFGEQFQQPNSLFYCRAPSPE